MAKQTSFVVSKESKEKLYSLAKSKNIKISTIPEQLIAYFLRLEKGQQKQIVWDFSNTDTVEKITIRPYINENLLKYFSRDFKNTFGAILNYFLTLDEEKQKEIFLIDIV